MTKDEALRLALRAMVVNNYAWKYLAESGDAGNFEAEEQGYYQLNKKAIIAVEAALEAKVEPVAWWIPKHKAPDMVSKVRWSDECEPLYTTPPDTPILQAISDEYNAWIHYHSAGHSFDEFLKAKLKEKNT
jgi:hypothetical protein